MTQYIKFTALFTFIELMQTCSRNNIEQKKTVLYLNLGGKVSNKRHTAFLNHKLFVHAAVFLAEIREHCFASDFHAGTKQTRSTELVPQWSMLLRESHLRDRLYEHDTRPLWQQSRNTGPWAILWNHFILSVWWFHFRGSGTLLNQSKMGMQWGLTGKSD